MTATATATASTKFALDADLAKYASKPERAAKPELVLVYSRPGGGKTHLASTAADLPHVNKVLYLDTEGSTVGVTSRIANADKIDVVRVDQHPTPFEFLTTIINRIESEGTGYGVIVIDTFDVAQNWAVKHFEEHAPLGRSGQRDGFAYWGQVKEWSEKVARVLQKSPALGVLVVHDKEEKTASGAITKRLNLVGSSKDVLPGIPGIVVYLERVRDGDTVTSYAYFESEDGKVTKNRFNLPPKVANLTFPALFKFIDDQANNTNPKN